MVVSMVAFSVDNVMLKNGCSNSAYWTHSYALWRWGCCFFTGVAKLNNQSLYPKEVLSKPMRMRVLFEITGRLFYMLAIALTPLGHSRYCNPASYPRVLLPEQPLRCLILGSLSLQDCLSFGKASK